METHRTQRRSLPLPLIFAGSVALTLGISVAVFFGLMHPSLKDLAALIAFLSITSAISIAAGYGAYRWDWISRSPRLHWTLLGSYVLSCILILVNVGVTAVLMFVSQHDLMLAAVLLLFAGGIAVSLGYFMSASLVDRIVELNEAAGQIARGRLGVRVPNRGRDEIAELTRTFNQMSEQLQAVDRRQHELEALRRDLVAWVGHDLRTPLASLRVIVEALADGVVQDPETVERYLETAQRQIRSLSLLLDDLFELAQLDAGGLQLECHISPISDLISDTIEGFSALATQRSVTLEGSVETGIGAVPMDVQKIERVISNLLDNALRHTPPGGLVHVNACAQPDCIQVQVHDTGEGIAAEDLPHIFERFYRGEKSRSRSTGGAGLGLAIASGIVRAHGGQIGVESATGRGTRIWFTLPFEQPAKRM